MSATNKDKKDDAQQPLPRQQRAHSPLGDVLKSNTRRLNRTPNYVRPEQTYNDYLTENVDLVKEKLTKYVPVDSIASVPIRTHVRYFIPDPNTKGKWLFRLGGFLVNKNNPDIYVVLSNTRTTWSVNTKTAKFWRILRPAELQAREMERQASIIKKQQQELASLKHKGSRAAPAAPGTKETKKQQKPQKQQDQVKRRRRRSRSRDAIIIRR